ncbi:MAG: hypothetical protein IJ356_06900 [Erysipelotrichaceae bacterium]|nr:hypothetical protein [Erysipelotrichaceae bacterium]
MITILSVILIVASFSVASIGYGTRLCKKSSFSLQFLCGFATVLGIIEIIDLLLFSIVSSKLPMYIGYTIVFGIGFYLAMKTSKKINLKKCLWLALYLFAMLIIMANRTIGEPNFDSVFYLSYVGEWANSLNFESMVYETGALTQKVQVLYDFQAFYHVHAFFLWLIQSANMMVYGLKTTVVQIYVWSSMIQFSILLFFFSDAAACCIEEKNKWMKAAVYIFVLGIVGNFYWNNALGFFGNSYRQLYSAVFSLQIFNMLKNKQFDCGQFVRVALLSSAMLSMSSTSLFLNFIVCFGLVFVLLYQEIDHLGTKIAVLVFPTVLFGVNYIYYSYGIFTLLLIPIGLFYTFCFVFDKLSYNLQKKILFILKTVLKAVPAIIGLLSIFVWLRGNEDVWMFFRNHSQQDMVWDLFSARDALHLILNGIYLFGIFHLVKRKASSFYLKYLLYMMLLFINPLNVIVLKKYLSGIVFYRAYEVIFNYFTFAVLIIECMRWFENRKIVLQMLCSSLCVLALLQSITFYHSMFEVNEQFDKLYKVEKDELDLLLYFNMYLTNELERATVVSQMDSLKTFTPNIKMAFKLRGLDKYTLNENDDELMKIFYPRDYAGQIIFEEEPDFTCACDRLIEKQIDYVVLDKMQVYDTENGYESLYYLVRDCADLLYENDRYALFRFYW